ncbi:MAG: bifunctional methylenetetrahydrofolate dehydrogenase/methenyltetrahydrofolate cyclohydrolase FolD [Dethiobacteria bacterium]|jgi:methylenetetrahydrofolate dehydrogenase (NADP+)/methenyltetrahydrofolate cyclohydrolase|nr:bifunctional methylenetetrahydrofolate dehydrogenase/methenyltetrahydrofolate cyclohydrolase FolD [Bacillota bacterium]
MSAQLLRGMDVAQKIRGQIKEEMESLKQKTGKVPGLAVVLVGENPASQTYVKHKERTSKKLGFYSEVHRLPAKTTQAELLHLVEELNNSEHIHGILVQLPLLEHIKEEAVIHAISAEKDVDGFHPLNVGKLVIGERCYIPCTAYGVIKMLEHAGIELQGKHAVVVGRSNIVGKPVALLLLERHATVTVCHSRTANLAELCRSADVLVVAVGRPEMIKGSWIKPGAVVIDVGINRVGGKLVGDVDFNAAKEVASWITPVPGGVGPMTITMLMVNTLQSFKYKLFQR